MDVKAIIAGILAGCAVCAATPVLAQDAGEDVSPQVGSDALIASAAAPATADTGMDRLELDRTEIVGNQELPQVLYIVPWKSSDMGDLVGRPVNTLLDEVLAPTDREVFVRQIGYYEDLNEAGGDAPAMDSRRAEPAASEYAEEQSQ